jgi:putative ABC transport system permease protein
VSAPLQTYGAPGLTAADARTRALLGGRPLLPSGNVAGYLTQPPLILTNLASLPRFTAPHYDPGLARAPISAIRVRVAGVRGIDDVSRERVRRAAEAIQRRTGLQVDLTIGSSPAPKTIALPAGLHGRPALTVHEPWIRKGVGVAILDAVDRKSLVLFGLILVVCMLFVANATAAAVRARRTELGVLVALGWGTGRLFGAVLWELGTIGACAGVLGAGLALALSAATGTEVDVVRCALAVPAAIGLTLAAGAVPAWRAARATPVDALRPAVRAGHGGRPRGVAGLAALNLRRVPGRTLLAALSLAVGVCALTLLLATTLAFHGVLVGSLLGDLVSVRVRAVDYVAVITTILLGAFSVADVLYLNLRERAAEMATLHATGWAEKDLGRLVVFEGLGIGVAGALPGAALGLAGAAALAGAVPVGLVAVTALAAAAGTVVATGASLVPVALLWREPVAAALGGD